MDTKDLMSGIAVVIDDALDGEVVVDGDIAKDDVIGRIVEWFEREWDVPFVKSTSLPAAALWPNLLQAASFVLLDWQLWGAGGAKLKAETIRDITSFLRSARKKLVPVFIFTNTDPDEVKDQLPEDVYADNAPGRSFVFVGRKDSLWIDDSVDIGILEGWVHGNASVYVLRTWDQLLETAKNELFRAMCDRSVEWPRVFWKEYVADGAEPSASLTNLINDSLRGRMRMDAFKDEYLGGEIGDIAGEELRGLIGETSFRLAEFLPQDEIRCGDVYKATGGKYLLNLRPDCDCIPRGEEVAGDLEVHCIEGKKAGPTKLRKLYKKKTGNFREPVFESVAFAIIAGSSLVFDFRKVHVMKFSQVREKRVGRLLHPYLDTGFSSEMRSTCNDRACRVFLTPPCRLRSNLRLERRPIQPNEHVSREKSKSDEQVRWG